MKKQTRNYSFRFKWFWLMLALVVVVLIPIIVLDTLYLDDENWINILTSITKDSVTAVLITFIVGNFFKMITDKFFLIKKNDKLLKKFGVHEIGGGISTLKDKHDIFGCGISKSCPAEIHILSITGDCFLEEFQSDIEACLKQGCNVKILLVSTKDANREYIKNLENIYGGKENFAQLVDKSKEIVSGLKKRFNEKISLRFYDNEYFYNYRSATYVKTKEKRGCEYNLVYYKSIINIQPFNRNAKDCSISLSGTYSDRETSYEKSSGKENQDSNIFYNNEKAFEKLWEKYEETELT